MRLLNVHTLLFKEFHDGSRDVPAYIIASHRWLAQDDEATYKIVLKKKARDVQREGYRKVERFCGMRTTLNSMKLHDVDFIHGRVHPTVKV